MQSGLYTLYTQPRDNRPYSRCTCSPGLWSDPMDIHHPGAYPASLILSTMDHTLFTLPNILAANQYSPCLSHTTLTTRTALAFGVRGWDQLTIFVKWLGLQLRGTWLQGESMKGNFHKNCFDRAALIWKIAFETRAVSPR